MTPTDVSPLIRLHANDNVLVAKTALSLGQVLADIGTGTRARAQVPAGHKIAACRIGAGERILKYDTIIGAAARDIEAGDYVHTHNMTLVDFARDPGFGQDVQEVQYVPQAERATFMGFVRPDGRVGTRNFIGILASVNCSATVIKNIAAHFTPQRLAVFPNVDGVAAFAQTSGCGMSSPSEHFDVLRRTLAGYARHPNLGGVLIVGLGCERNQVASLVESQGLPTSKLMRTLVMQEVGGTRATIEAGIAAIEEMLPLANAATRQPVSASHLKIGLECGGSEKYTAGHNAQFNGVVGHGNQAGGLANIFEKSLGSAMKCGTTPLQAVYEYAEPIDQHGFVFMDSPGYDPVACTGQIASGANLICFTTGRGSMFGSKPAPTIKLASNTPMFTRLEEDMDINCGAILDGEVDVPQMGQRIFEAMLRHASGQPTKSEALGLGDHEFIPWHLGIVS